MMNLLLFLAECKDSEGVAAADCIFPISQAPDKICPKILKRASQNDVITGV
jgi:hypothetical protein